MPEHSGEGPDGPVAGSIYGRLTLLSALIVLAACVESEGPSLSDEFGRMDGQAVALPACSDCGLALDSLAVLFDDAAPASFMEDVAFRPCSIAEVGDSTFVAGRLVGGGALQVYSRAGKYLRSVGGRGQGPGEFAGDLRLLPDSSGQLLVIDRGQARLTAFDSNWDLRFARSLPIRPDAQTLGPSGDLIIHARPSPVDEGPVDRFLRVNRESGVVSPLGPKVPVHTSPELREFDQWLVESIGDRGFVGTSIWNYRLVLFDAAGQPGVVRRREEVWAPRTTPEIGFLDGIYVERPPPATVASLQRTSDGLLRVYTRTPEEDWTPNEFSLPTPEWGERNFDTHIDLIDPDDFTVIATERFDPVLAPVCGSDLAFSSERLAGGDIAVKILAVRPTG